MKMNSYDKNTDYFKIWLDYKKSTLDTMVKNLVYDLEAGYDYFAENIKKQRMEIEVYKHQLDAQLEIMAEFSYDRKINKWCHMDLIKRGVIEE